MMFETLQHPDCLPIGLPYDDTFYSKWNHTCMEFLRSSPAPKQNCALGPREQINQVSSRTITPTNCLNILIRFDWKLQFGTEVIKMFLLSHEKITCYHMTTIQ